MMNPEKRFSSACCVSVVIALAFTTFNLGVHGTSTIDTKGDVEADSSIVLYHFPSSRDPVMVSTTLSCEAGKVRSVVRVETENVLRADVPTSLESYLALWVELEQNGIWELPPGEYWPWRDLLEAGGVLPKVELIKEDYQQIPSHGDIVGVKVRVRDKTHGYMRYFPQHLKDPRYSRILTAIWDCSGLQESVIRLRNSQHRGKK